VNLRQQLLDNNYLVIDNFITEDRAKELYQLFKNEANTNPKAFYHDPKCPRSLCIYNFRWFLELLIEKTPFMSEILEEPMLPTYSYARIYANQEILTKHKDRHACEISVTLHLDSDGTEWPIWLTKPDGEQVSHKLKSGQAIIYLGMISEHWRDVFQGQEYGQLFLHYVRSRSENWIYYFDKFQQ